MRYDCAYRFSLASAVLATLRAATFGVVAVVALAYANAQDVTFDAPQPAASPSGQSAPPPQASGQSGQGSNARATGAASSSQDVAEVILKNFYQVNANQTSVVSGEPLSLLRALYGVYSPNERLRRLLAYWNFSYKYAYLNLCATYQADVDSCVGKIMNKYGSSAPSETTELLNTMRQLADERRADAKLTFMQAQYDFDAAFTTPRGRQAAIARATAAGKNVGEGYAILYIPSTAPATSSYNTRFEQLAQARRATAETARLNAQIPLLYETLQKRASQAARLHTILEKEFTAATVAEDALFAALDNDFDAKNEALKAAARYNQAIALYAAQTVPTSVQDAAFLATINQRVSDASRTSSATGARANSSGNATPAAGSGQTPTNRPATTTTTSLWLLPGVAPYPNDSYEEGYNAGYAAATNSSVDNVEPLIANIQKTNAALDLTTPTYALSTLAYTNSYTAPTLQTVGYLTPSAQTTTLGGGNSAQNLTEDSLPENNDATPTANSSEISAANPTENPQPETATPETAPATDPTTAQAPEDAKNNPETVAPSTKETQPSAPQETKPEEPAKKPNDGGKPGTPPEPKKDKAPDEKKQDEKPKEATITAQNEAKDWAIPSEFANEDAQEAFFPIIVLVTGFEQPRNDATTNGVQKASSQDNAPDGAFLFKLNFNLVSSVRNYLDSLCDEAYELAREEDERGWIVRGQEPIPSSSGSATSASSQSQSGATANAAENERAVALRAQEIGRALFAVPIIVASAQTPGEEERLFSLQEVAQRARAVTPEMRARVANEYWRLCAAVAKLRVEETMLQTYVSIYQNSSGAAREERALAVALEAQARVAEARAAKRGVQTNLLRLMALTQASSAYPLPSTQPFCGVKFQLGSPPYPNATTLRVGALIQERIKVMQSLGAAFRSPAELLNIDLASITDDNADVAFAALAKKRERTLYVVEQIQMLNCAISEYVANYPGYVSIDQYVDAIVGR